MSSSGQTGSPRGEAIACAASATDPNQPAPAAASIAAPRDVVSTSSGRETGRPVTCARSSRLRRPFAPPATQTISRGACPAPAIASRTSRNASAFPSSSERTRCGRPCAAVTPYQPARARGFHSGAIAPASAGTQTTPSDPAGASSASAFSDSYDAPSDPSSSRNHRYAPSDSQPGFSSSHVSGSACGCSSTTLDALNAGALTIVHTGSAVPITSHTTLGLTTPAPSVAAILSPHSRMTTAAAGRPVAL